MPIADKSLQYVSIRRNALGWTQEELARKSGIPRTTISAIEGRRLTPSVTAALALASALDCSVEELFGNAPAPSNPACGPAWAWSPPGLDCRYWEAEIGGRALLFPVEWHRRHALAHDGIWQGGVAGREFSQTARDTLVMASCDPAAGLLAAEYARTSGYRLLAFERSGVDALELLKSGKIHVAGIHRSTTAEPDRNSRTVLEKLGDGYRLIRMADWEEGLVFPSGQKSRSIQSISRQTDSWALRETGSAARECLDELLEFRPAPGRCVSGHMAVAEAVKAGWAGAGVCVKIAASECGLGFLPIRTESLDLCIARDSLRDPRLISLLHLLRSRAHRLLLSQLPGYNALYTGEWTL